jgi:hypothetical protein
MGIVVKSLELRQVAENLSPLTALSLIEAINADFTEQLELGVATKAGFAATAGLVVELWTALVRWAGPEIWSELPTAGFELGRSFSLVAFASGRLAANETVLGDYMVACAVAGALAPELSYPVEII